MDKELILKKFKKLHSIGVLRKFETAEEVRNWANEVVTIMKNFDYSRSFECTHAARQLNFEILSIKLQNSYFNIILSQLDQAIKELELKIEIENGIQKQIYFPAGSHLGIQKAVAQIIVQATQSLYICDRYMDEKIIEELTNVNAPCIKLLTNLPKPPLFSQRLNAARQQYSSKQIEVKTSNNIHDRFYIIDEDQVWSMGTSYNNAGNKSTLISELKESQEKQKAIDDFNAIWNTASIFP